MKIPMLGWSERTSRGGCGNCLPWRILAPSGERSKHLRRVASDQAAPRHSLHNDCTGRDDGPLAHIGEQAGRFPDPTARADRDRVITRLRDDCALIPEMLPLAARNADT